LQRPCRRDTTISPTVIHRARGTVERFMIAHGVFVTGGTGYMGRALISALLARGYRVTALVRPGSEGKLPLGCASVAGSALDAATFAATSPRRERIARP
jgi:nucleoside-diphosphate-sugar epimerase